VVAHEPPTVVNRSHTRLRHCEVDPQSLEDWQGVPGAGSLTHVSPMHTKGALQRPPTLQPSPRLPPSVQRFMQLAPLQLRVPPTQSLEVSQAPLSMASGVTTTLPQALGSEQPELPSSARQLAAATGSMLEAPMATERSVGKPKREKACTRATSLQTLNPEAVAPTQRVNNWQ
jgi:hypothetical protein